MKRARPSNAKIWARQRHDHYVEEPWVSRRLFEEVAFAGAILDPACGFGNIVRSARGCGLAARGTDIVKRHPGMRGGLDFLASAYGYDGPTPFDIVCNPPFDLLLEFAAKALALVSRCGGKVAMIFPSRRLNAAGKWLERTPLRQILYLTPRPSMPPGDVYAALAAAGKKPGRGRQDYCWLVWEVAAALRVRTPTLPALLPPGVLLGGARVGWLHRDQRSFAAWRRSLVGDAEVRVSPKGDRFATEFA